MPIWMMHFFNVDVKNLLFIFILFCPKTLHTLLFWVYVYLYILKNNNCKCYIYTCLIEQILQSTKYKRLIGWKFIWTYPNQHKIKSNQFTPIWICVQLDRSVGQSRRSRGSAAKQWYRDSWGSQRSPHLVQWTAEILHKYTA